MHTKEVTIKGERYQMPVPVWNYVKRILGRFERYKKDIEHYKGEINRLNELVNVKNKQG